MGKDYLTATEAAEKMSVSYRRIHQLIEAGKLRAERFGKVWLIPVSALSEVQTYGKPGRPPKAEAASATKPRAAKKAGAKSAKKKGGA
jgi:excisionase family DNA binding protein